MNISKENYLKTIFRLQKEICTNKLLAAKLGISAPSVTEMVRKLREEGLVRQQVRKIELTDSGNLLAKKIIRKHRIWEVFLSEKLLYPDDRVHELAEKLEHATDDELLQRLEQFLSYPKVCPHGMRIDESDEIH